jgi:hypothetical protein
MAMVVESSTQVRGCAEVAHDVRMVVKHTFLELIVDDDFGVRSQNARHRASSEPRKLSDHMVHLDKYEQKSAASTQANDTDDDCELIDASDDEEPMTPPQAPPGVFAQAQPQQNFVPVCVAFVPVMQQPVWKKSSRSARRRRARAMNRWFRYNTTAEGEQQDGAFDLDGEFDDEWQLPDSDAESPEIDAAESWPMPNSFPEVQHDKKKA